MRTYIIRRLLLMIPTLLVVSLVIFSIVRLFPGDVVTLLLAETPSMVGRTAEILRHQLGLDRPYHEAYLLWLWDIFHGNLGESLWTGRSVAGELVNRIPVSLELALLTALTTTLVAIPFGVLAALRQDTWMDYGTRFLTIGGLSVPDFWAGTILIMLPALWFRYMPPLTFTPLFDDPLRNLQQILVPAVALGIRLAAINTRLMRTAMLEVLRQDYIRTAWAKGLRERTIALRHGVKNALIPVMTYIGSQMGHLIGGTVIIETIFGLPGVGRSTIDAVQHRDYTQLQANVLFMAVTFLVINLVVDILYSYLDPRIRYQ